MRKQYSPPLLRRWTSYGLLGMAALLGACGGGADAPALQSSIDEQLTPAQAQTAQRCDVLDSSHCMLPFPSNFLTQPDSNTSTGLRLNLQQASMPRSAIAGDRAIDPAEWNRNDGFSPGAMLVTRVPDLDLQASGAPRIGDLTASLDKNASILLLNAQTLEPQLMWAELDENNVSSPDKQTLNIRVAKNLEWGQRYIVVLRQLKNAQGELLQASPGFRIFRDRHESAIEAINARRPHMEALFAQLEKAGIDRQSLYLAWDFTVASQANLTGRLLSMRDQGLPLNGAAPSFRIDQVKDQPDGSDSRIARRVLGTLTVPSFLSLPEQAVPALRLELSLMDYALNQRLNLADLRQGFQDLGNQPAALPQLHYASTSPAANALPVQNGSMEVPFVCNIPQSVLRADGTVEPARIALYGHGLFGNKEEVNAGNVKDMASEHNFVFCAVDWYGFSLNEVTKSVISMLDLSYARSMFDMTQQGIFNTLALGRAMKHADGFTTHPAFHMGAAPQSVLDTQALFYDGNSQGGILGGALMALSQDVQRGVLGVPGMNYSLLLERSTDFPKFSALVYAAYPDSLEQQLIFSLWQTLWDRAEANGYAAAMGSQPLPNTPQHQVLMQVAYGDHKVTTWAAEVMARSLGAKRWCPSLEDGRHPDAKPFVGMECANSGDKGASVLVMWDSGLGRTQPPPQNNTPPVAGIDPHSDPRATPQARLQKSEFLRVDGSFVDTCAAGACKSAAYVP